MCAKRLHNHWPERQDLPCGGDSVNIIKTEGRMQKRPYRAIRQSRTSDGQILSSMIKTLLRVRTEVALEKGNFNLSN